jgi:hypothetical protein
MQRSIHFPPSGKKFGQEMSSPIVVSGRSLRRKSPTSVQLRRSVDLKRGGFSPPEIA